MKFSKRTKQADVILVSASIIGLLYTVMNLLILTYGLKDDFNKVLLPVDLMNNFLPLIIGSLLIGAYDIYVNNGTKNSVDDRIQKEINFENSHQNTIKGFTLFTSALISLLCNLYKLSPIIIFVLIVLYLMIVLIVLVIKAIRYLKKLIKKLKR
ncbi:hypothetical protein K4Q07_08725 [Staphylococcus epidermidis]|nr:hypothetical protein [Staphylococcus epidermidis]